MRQFFLTSDTIDILSLAYLNFYLNKIISKICKRKFFRTLNSTFYVLVLIFMK